MKDSYWKDLIAGTSSITLLVGENGSGKSRCLSGLSSWMMRHGHRTIAIANTVFDRFPRSRKEGYVRLSPSVGKSYASNAFKKALIGASDAVPRNASLIGRSLEYTGFSPIIGLHVRLRRKFEQGDLAKLLPGSLRDQDVARIIRAFDIYRAYNGERQSMWVNMYGEQIGPDRRELLDLLTYEQVLKKARLIESISLTVERHRTIYDLSEASSGELSLLATYAFLATNIKEGDVILVDEPENSLHPRWQREYCNQLFDQFYQYAPKLILATHSPQIVQGADGANVPVEVLSMPDGAVVAEPFSKSIEGTLFEAFGVLSPANHYLSEKVTSMLNDLAKGRASLTETTDELDRLKALSVDADQKEFLAGAVGLASKVIETLKERRGA